MLPNLLSSVSAQPDISGEIEPLMRNLVRGNTSYTLLGLDVRLLGVLSTLGEPISYQGRGGHTIR